MNLEEIQKLKPNFVCFQYEPGRQPEKVYLGLSDVTEDILKDWEFSELNDKGYPVFVKPNKDEDKSKSRAEEIISQIRSHKLRKVIEKDDSDNFFDGVDIGIERGKAAVRALMNLYDDRHIP